MFDIPEPNSQNGLSRLPSVNLESPQLKLARLLESQKKIKENKFIF